MSAILILDTSHFSWFLFPKTGNFFRIVHQDKIQIEQRRAEAILHEFNQLYYSRCDTTISSLLAFLGMVVALASSIVDKSQIPLLVLFLFLGLQMMFVGSYLNYRFYQGALDAIENRIETKQSLYETKGLTVKLSKQRLGLFASAYCIDVALVPIAKSTPISNEMGSDLEDIPPYTPYEV